MTSCSLPDRRASSVRAAARRRIPWSAIFWASPRVPPESIALIFERFISKERGEPPDIDVDFEHERREEVIQWNYDRYGRERAGTDGNRDRAAGVEVAREVLAEAQGAIQPLVPHSTPCAGC